MQQDRCADASTCSVAVAPNSKRPHPSIITDGHPDDLCLLRYPARKARGQRLQAVIASQDCRLFCEIARIEQHKELLLSPCREILRAEIVEDEHVDVYQRVQPFVGCPIAKSPPHE